MTENKVFEMILGIKEIQVDRVDWQDQSLHIHCSSIFGSTLSPLLKEETGDSSNLCTNGSDSFDFSKTQADHAQERILVWIKIAKLLEKPQVRG